MISPRIELEPLEKAAASFARRERTPGRRKRRPHPGLDALIEAGTRHVYVDSADVKELEKLFGDGEDLPAGIDGNTANQPLVHEVVDRYLEDGDPAGWSRELDRHREKLQERELMPLLYSILCGRIGNDMTAAFADDGAWEVSLQLHMGLSGRRQAAIRVGHLLREMTPNAMVKVPFTPDAPDCFLVARDLERAGIPVNFTSTFSARQAVAASLLADVTRTNIFMGRLNQGLRTPLLGEHVDLEAQRAIRKLRSEHGVKTRLIVASMREAETFELVAGCDAFTAPAKVLRPFLEQEQEPGSLKSKLETSYEDRLETPADVLERIDAEAVARLYRVEPGFVRFLEEYRNTEEFSRSDGDMLLKRFTEAGFGDLFHAPDRNERTEMERGKLPDLDGDLIGRVAVDTHFSLLANADFARHQHEIDLKIDAALAHGQPA